MKQKAKQKEIDHLNDIYDLARIDTELAWQEALHAMHRHESKKLTYAYAKAQMIVFIIASQIRNNKISEIDELALLEYFEANGYIEDASLIMLAIITGWIGSKEKHETAVAMEDRYEKSYADKVPFRHKIQRIIQRGNYNMMRNLNKTAQVELALKAEAMLRTVTDDSAWYRTSLAQILILKAEALSHTAEIDKVRSAIDESIALVDRPGTSLHYIYTAYYFKGNVAAVADRTEEALEAYQHIEKRFQGQPFYNPLLLFVYLQIFKQLNVKSSASGLPASQKKALLNEQMKYIGFAKALSDENPRPYNIAYIALSEGRLRRLTGEYDLAIVCLARAMRTFMRSNITNHIIDIYEEAYHVYQSWAEKDHNYILYRKAMRSLKCAHDLTYKYNQAEGKEKMDALINQYELRQKELNEKLLHQKMEAMNKEIQMTALTLHEKVTVLDELKEYVTSLKKKGQETNQLINAITKKIDAVIITEQDKTSLQQKIDKGNREFYKMISERYPALSNLEIHTCGLLKTGMTNKDLSKLYGQSEKSYEQHRYRIKKKLGLTAKDNLIRFLNSVV